MTSRFSRNCRLPRSGIFSCGCLSVCVCYLFVFLSLSTCAYSNFCNAWTKEFKWGTQRPLHVWVPMSMKTGQGHMSNNVITSPYVFLILDCVPLKLAQQIKVKFKKESFQWLAKCKIRFLFLLFPLQKHILNFICINNFHLEQNGIVLL